MKTTSAISTSRKMAAENPKTNQYVLSMRAAFGDCGETGAKPPLAAAAEPAVASAMPAMRPSRAGSLVRTGWHSKLAMAASRVELPDDVSTSLEVFVNGVPQRPGLDFEQLGRTLVFKR